MAPIVISVIFAALIALRLYSTGIMIRRLRPVGPLPSESYPQPISLIVSIAGLSKSEALIATSAIELAGPNVEILFCASERNEPGARVIHNALEQRRLLGNPNIRVLFSGPQHNRNPKLGNIRKGYAAARHDAVVLVDGNIEVPADFPAQLWDVWTPGVGLVSTVPLAIMPQSFWASVEMSLLTGVYARWLLAGDQIGITFASGKILAFYRSWLDTHGGLKSLESCVAEDMALYRLARKTGVKINLIRTPLEQPLGNRTAAEFIGRATRWMKIRRSDIPVGYAMEFIYTFWFLLLVSGIWAFSNEHSLIIVWASILVFWHISESVTFRRFNQSWSPLEHIHILVRDALTLPMWINGWFGKHYKWRGQNIRFR